MTDCNIFIYHSKVLDGLKVGNEALKKANDMFSIDEIEQILEDSAEAAAKQDEINAMLSGQLSAADEDDVLKELDQLIQEDESAEAEKKAEQLPEVPGEELPGSSSSRLIIDGMTISGKMHLFRPSKQKKSFGQMRYFSQPHSASSF